jgi:hypothetical protein
VAFLADVAASGSIQESEAQKKCVEEFLGEARQRLTLPSIPLPPAKLSEITFSGLPTGIHLVPGQLTIQFQGATDLLEKLFSLSQALANDFETLESAVAGGHHD